MNKVSYNISSTVNAYNDNGKSVSWFVGFVYQIKIQNTCVENCEKFVKVLQSKTVVQNKMHRQAT